MSAFLVEPQHIAEIVKWANRDEMGNYAYNCFTKSKIDCEPKNMIRLLAQANIDSLIARYGDTWPKEDFEGYVQDCLDILPYATDGIGESLLDGVGYCQLQAKDIYNMLCCWDYQSCEVDNWFETDAYWLHVYLKDACARKMAKDAEITWSFNPKFTPDQLREAYK
jgi:hypothetical protein